MGCSRLVPLRFVIVFPCGLNFSAGPWAITPENLPTGRDLRKIDYVNVSCDPSMVTALQHGTWMDEEGFKKTCIREKKKRGGIYQPFYGTWVADFMLRQDAGRFMLGKYLSEKKSHGGEGDDWGWLGRK